MGTSDAQKTSRRGDAAEFAVTPCHFLDRRLGRAFFQEASDNGFDKVELAVYAGHFSATEDEVRFARQMCKEYSLEVASMHCNFEALSGRRIRETESLLTSDFEVLSELGGRFLIVHAAIFADPDNIIEDETGHLYPEFSLYRDLENEIPGTLERVKEGMVFYAEKAKELGVAVALETSHGKDSRVNHRLLEFISDAAPEACGICFDTGHAQIDSDAAAQAEMLAPRVVCTHLHDNDGKEDLHLPPFRGVIDWTRLLNALTDTGYRGGWTFECLGGTIADIVDARSKFMEMLSSV